MNYVELAKLIADVGFPIVCSAIFIILMVKSHKQQQKWLNQFIERSMNGNHPSAQEENALDIINNKIYQELRGVINALKADRVYLFLYHNGGASSSGLYFQRMSCICEVVSQGILPVADQKQSLYRASYTTLSDNLKTKGEYLLPDVHELKGKDDFMYQILTSRHSESSYYRALKDSQGNVIGFIGVDYCALNDKVPDDRVMKLLRTVSHKVSSLVDIRDEVKQ